jgi:transposase
MIVARKLVFYLVGGIALLAVLMWGCPVSVDTELGPNKRMDPTMKQNQKQTPKRRRYDEQYKRDVVRLWQESGRLAEVIAEELGIPAVNLYRWKAELEQGPPPGAARRTVAELEAEVAALRAENARLVEQREILKKAAGILSQPSRSGLPESKP